MERHRLGDLREVPAADTQGKMLIDMLDVREIVQEWLPDSFKLRAAPATIVAVLNDHYFGMLTASLVRGCQIQPVNIERDRYSAKEIRRNVLPCLRIEEPPHKNILAAHYKEHTWDRHAGIGLFK